MTTLTAARLRELLHYDPETGIFTWKVSTKKIRAGQTAGSKNREGYINIQIQGCKWKAHRLALLYVTGYMPAMQVDHINGNPMDNRLCNLREASHTENRRNAGVQRNNKSGFKGVCWSKQNKGWHAQISIDGKRTSLGYFSTPESAHEAYKIAAKRLHGEFANFGKLASATSTLPCNPRADAGACSA